MALIWGESLQTGIDEMDSDHRELFSSINTMVDLWNQEAEDNDVQEAIDETERKLVEHFSREEKLMQEYGYIYAKEHSRMHESFVSDFCKIKDLLACENDRVAKQILIQRMIVDWWIRHILTDDRILASAIRNASQVAA